MAKSDNKIFSAAGFLIIGLALLFLFLLSHISAEGQDALPPEEGAITANSILPEKITASTTSVKFTAGETKSFENDKILSDKLDNAQNYLDMKLNYIIMKIRALEKQCGK